MKKSCEQIIVALLLAIVVGVPLYMDGRMYSVYDLSKTTLLYLLTFGIIATYCVKRIGDSSGKFEFNPLTLPTTCFFIIAFFATCFSVGQAESLFGSYKRYNGLFSLFIYLVVFYSVVTYIKYDYIFLFINAIIISTCIVCAYGICQAFGIDYFKWNTDYGHRVFSSIGHPGFLSAYLIMVLPLVYYKMFNCNKAKEGILFGAVVVVILITFFLTKTRATFLGLILSNVFFFVCMGKELVSKHRLKVILAVVAIVGLSVGFNMKGGSAFDRTVKDISRKSGSTITNRYYNALVAKEIIKDYPVLGIGFGNIGKGYPYYIKEVYRKTGATAQITEIQDRIHCEPLDVLVTMGILGFVAYLYCVFGYIKMIYRSVREHDLLLVAIGSGVLACWVQNWFSFGNVPILVLFWFFLGLSVILCQANRRIVYET